MGTDTKYRIIRTIMIIIVICLIYFFTPGCKETFGNIDFKNNLDNVANPYIKPTSNHNNYILWPKLNTDFMKNNWPNTFDFEYDIKEDIISNALRLPINSCIIDCGAHIGDGSIPIAHAMKYYNRNDITIYAIDPSKYKCDFINFIKNNNNLNNLIVLNYGLSSKNSKYTVNKTGWGINTGGWGWAITNKTNNTNNENINEFIKLDDLVNKNIIKPNIGILHLDAEGGEVEALIGANNVIDKNKPYISIENNSRSGKDINGNNNSLNNNYYLKWLPYGYKYMYNKHENNILNIQR